MALDIDGVMRLASTALAKGGQQVSPLRVEWDCSGKCQEPVHRDVQAGPYRDRLFKGKVLLPSEWCSGSKNVRIIYRPKWRHGFTVSLTVKCRKCERCRMERKWLWVNRAKRETAASFRTWFGTLTLRPDVYMGALNACRKVEINNGGDFEALTNAKQFALVHARVSRQVTLLVKRLRMSVDGPIRYLLVAEVHKSGVPHYHMLVHECAAGAYVKERILSQEWALGFSKWRLVNSLAEASYLCKYLSKSTAARVRASVRYGSASAFAVGKGEGFQSLPLPWNTTTEKSELEEVPGNPEPVRFIGTVLEEASG